MITEFSLGSHESNRSLPTTLTAETATAAYEKLRMFLATPKAAEYRYCHSVSEYWIGPNQHRRLLCKNPSWSRPVFWTRNSCLWSELRQLTFEEFCIFYAIPPFDEVRS